MPQDDPPDRTKVTFSQAEGIHSLPRPLALGELSQEVRSLLWEFIYTQLESASYSSRSGVSPHILEPLLLIFYDLHVRFDHLPADEFSAETRVHVEKWKALVLTGAYNEVFNTLQFVLRVNAGVKVHHWPA